MLSIALPKLHRPVKLDRPPTAFGIPIAQRRATVRCTKLTNCWLDIASIG
jgi:hypothetical protein